MGGISGVGMVYFSMAWGVDSTLSPASFLALYSVQFANIYKVVAIKYLEKQI